MSQSQQDSKTDIITKRKRSEVMSRIRGKDTKPEFAVRRYLHRLGFRFRLHRKGVPGKPDLWLPKYNAAIFVNGCYFWLNFVGWHFAYLSGDSLCIFNCGELLQCCSRFAR